MHRVIIVLASLSLATSCAPQPGAIKALPVTSSPYATYDCAALGAERQRIDADYADAEAHQNRLNSNNPGDWIFFELKLLNSLDKRNEQKIARLKGERQALENETRRKGCA